MCKPEMGRAATGWGADISTEASIACNECDSCRLGAIVYACSGCESYLCDDCAQRHECSDGLPRTQKEAFQWRNDNDL